MSVLQHSELLPQGKIFEEQVATRAKWTDSCAETEPYDVEHDTDIAEKREQALRCKFLIPKPSRVLARDRTESLFFASHSRAAYIGAGFRKN